MLIAEQSASLRMLLKAMLQKLGVRDVLAVDSDSAALKQLQARSFDVLLCALPDELGVGLVSEAQHLAPAMRVVVIAPNKRAEREVNSPGIGVLGRPFTLGELQTALHGEPPPSGGFSGRVQELSLVDVLQLYHNSRRSITVGLQGPVSGQIMMAAGEIVHAEAGDLLGLAALAHLLGATRGTISTSLSQPTNTRTIDGSFPFVLLEASRQLDEQRHLQGELPTTVGVDLIAAPDELTSVSAAGGNAPGAKEEHEGTDDKTIVDLPPYIAAHSAASGGSAPESGHFPAVSSFRASLSVELPSASEQPTRMVSVRSAVASSSGHRRALGWALGSSFALAAVVLYWQLGSQRHLPSPDVPTNTVTTSATDLPHTASPQPASAEPESLGAEEPAKEPRLGVRTFALSIESDPAKATVIENGKVLGRTPLEVPVDRESVAVEPRRFVVKRRGYVPYVHSQGDSDQTVDVAVTLSRDARSQSAADSASAVSTPAPASREAVSPAATDPRPAPPARNDKPLEIRLQR